MTRHVVATAGHVDHGKSALVRALTGIEPDRWAEERRRGLTIDLGFAWTTLPSGRSVAFVDVPGHERFIGNMLAGLGPSPVVCFVVAADEGWSEQSSDHRDALAALGIEHGVVVVTKVDRVTDGGEHALAQARTELADTGLCNAPALVVSALEGTGLDALRSALEDVLSEVPSPDQTARVRMWIDRAFTITGAGTVVTGTLATGSLRRDDRLQLCGAGETRAVVVRGLESGGEQHDLLQPVVRAGVNLRGAAPDDIERGDLLLTPDAWALTDLIDVRRVTGPSYPDLPEWLTAHVGTAAIPARLRPLGDDHARLSLRRRLPLVLGDRLVLRDPGGAGILGGAQVLDAEPPPLTRRGAGARRSADLAQIDPGGDVAAEVARRGVVSVDHLRRLGLVTDPAEPPSGVRAVGEWWVHGLTYEDWLTRLSGDVRAAHERDALGRGVSRGAVLERLGLPAPDLLDGLVRDAGLDDRDGYIRAPGQDIGLGPAESAVAEVEARLKESPFEAPTADDLAELGLGTRELAAAERAGRLLRLGEIVLLPSAPAQAMRELAALPQPFTTSGARQALGTSRRVAIPLLEHLDRRGWTRRIDAGHREIVRSQG